MQYPAEIKLKLSLLCEFQEQVKLLLHNSIKTGRVLQALNDKNFRNFRLDKISPVMMSCYVFWGREIGGRQPGTRLRCGEKMAKYGVKQHKKSGTKRVERWSQARGRGCVVEMSQLKVMPIVPCLKGLIIYSYFEKSCRKSARDNPEEYCWWF